MHDSPLEKEPAMRVKFTGFEDYHTVVAGDFKDLTVKEFRKTEFPRNEWVEVSPDVAAALSDPRFGGRFEVEKVEEEPKSPEVESTPSRRSRASE